MKVSGTYTFDADQPTVWAVLLDPNALAKALPGVETLIPIEGETLAWRATAKIGLAGISGTFTGTVRLRDVQPITSYQLDVHGEGQQSIINGHAAIALAPASDPHRTVLTWTGDAAISGKLAGIGQRVINMAAPMLANQFFQGLAKQMPPPR